MSSTTAKGVPFPVGTDAAALLDTLIQTLAEWVDTNPGIAALTTTQRDALPAAGKWDGRVIYNTTTLALERYDGVVWVLVVEPIPAGTIRATIKTTADPGWLLFNQTVVGAQTAYPALWAIAPAGWKSGANLVLPSLDDTVLMDAGTVATLGTVSGSNTSTAILAHTHAIDHNHAAATTSSDGAHTHTYQRTNIATEKDGTGAPIAASISSETATATSSDGTHSHSLDLPNFAGTSGSTGSGASFSIAQRNLGVVFQVKAH